MNKIRFSTLINLMVVVFMVWGFTSCKSKKKASEISDAQQTSQDIEVQPVEEPEPEEKEPVRDSRPVKLSDSQKLLNYFDEIASASSASEANASIQEAMQLFSGSNAPVLIIIFDDGSQVDYDEPTTISKYLNYLKDTRNADTIVEEIVKDDNGNIKELVLRKK